MSKKYVENGCTERKTSDEFLSKSEVLEELQERSKERMIQYHNLLRTHFAEKKVTVKDPINEYIKRKNYTIPS